jgi:hypothetical protein
MTPENLRKLVNLVVSLGRVLYEEQNRGVAAYFGDILERTLSLLNQIDYAAMLYPRYGTENAERYSLFFDRYVPSSNYEKLPLSSFEKIKVTESILKELE